MAITTKKTVIGHVKGCGKLNVRARPSSNSDIVNIIDEGTEVTIDYSTISNKYYKIKTIRHNTRPLPDETIEGYCLNEFISIADEKETSNEAL